MTYTTTNFIRSKTGYSTTDISDTDLNNIISEATAEINSKINTKLTREKVEYIDVTRQNKIDGSNKTFYVKNSFNNYFGDTDDSGDVDTDDITVYIEDNENNLTEATVSSIDIDGLFTLSSIPSSATTVAIYVSYTYTFYNVNTPDTLIQLLATYLAASYAVLSVEHGLPSSEKFGNITISYSNTAGSYNKFISKYKELLGTVLVPLNKSRNKTYKYMI